MTNRMKLNRPKLLPVAMLLACLWPGCVGQASAAENAIAPEEAGDFVIGTGLIIGLPDTGDSAVDQRLVDRSIVGVLQGAGLNPWRGEIAAGRVAKVIVTAELSPGSKNGAPLTITITAVGDATSLVGGTLLPTLLRDPSGNPRALGQGAVAVADRVATAGGRLENPNTGGRDVTMVQIAIVGGGHVQEVAAAE